MDWVSIVAKIAENQLIPFGIMLYLLFPFILCIGAGWFLWQLISILHILDSHVQECNTTQRTNNELMQELKPFIQQTNAKQEATLKLVESMSNRV